MSLPNFDTFKQQFRGDLVLPADADYEKAISRWAVNAQRKAALVTFPKDARDVSETVKWVTGNKIPVAVRGGGHSASGASSVEGGVVIDLSRYIGGARVDPERRLAFVGGGALWKDVDEASMKHELATTAGTVNHTGVGGLILGGGYGYLSSEHGLAIDNLEEAIVVTADGMILKANDKENDDLFWGIRGGGGNFGVVTEFVLRLHPQRKTVYSGYAIFPETMINKIFAASDHWFEHDKTTSSTALISIVSPPPQKQPVIFAVLFYNGTEAEGREHFKWLLDMGPVVDKTGEMGYEQVNGLLANLAPHGRGISMTGASRSNPKITKKLYAEYEELSKQNPELSIIIGYEYFGLEKIRTIATDATAFYHRQAPSNIMLQCAYDGKAPNLTELETRAKGILNKLKGVASGGISTFSYANYSHESSPSAPARPIVSNIESTLETEAPTRRNPAVVAMFQDNYPRLQEIKAKYDPDCVFSRWFGIQPKVKA